MLRVAYQITTRISSACRDKTLRVKSHSTSSISQHRKMKVKIIPALEDNYMYLIIDEKTNVVAAVDPVEPDKVIASAQEEGLKISMALTTHHHWDHAGGNKDLVSKVAGLPVYGGDDRVDAITNKVKEGSTFNIGSLAVKCLFTPCHTKGHVCYFVQPCDSSDDPAVFTGDTLFIGGCGKFFEGTAEQMYNALIKSLGSLPGNTRVYCGHEYTVSNLKYALHAEPDNREAKEKLEWSIQRRSRGLPTVGESTIADEFKYNPFMRVEEESLKKSSGKSNAADVMRFLRTEKNNFRAT